MRAATRLNRRLMSQWRAIAAALLVLAIFATVWALSGLERGATATAAGSLWTWPQGAPGESDLQLSPNGEASLNALVDLSQELSPGVQTQTIKRVAPLGASAGSHGLVLVAAPGPADVPCFTIINNDIIGAREFSCIDDALEKAPILRFVASGGQVADIADWVGLVGVARSDVSRVTLVPAAAVGSTAEIELPLNAWRGFSYAADAPQPFPKLLRSYGPDGKLIEEEPTVP